MSIVHKILQGEARLCLGSARKYLCGLTVLLVAVSQRGAWGQESLLPGTRPSSAGIRVLDIEPPQAVVSYFGIMGAVPCDNAGVYTSPEASVSLVDLVDQTGGLSDHASGMAHVIRDGRASLRVFWSPDSTERLLPGDLVVFQSRRDVRPRDGFPEHNAQGAETDVERVQVAFVGLFDRQPVVVALDKNFANLESVLNAMQQPPGIAETVNIIRTDASLGPLAPGTLPERLADGDVLIFDRRMLNPIGLAQAMPFPAPIPMTVPVANVETESNVESATDVKTASHVKTASDGPWEVTIQPAGVESMAPQEITQESLPRISARDATGTPSSAPTTVLEQAVTEPLSEPVAVNHDEPKPSQVPDVGGEQPNFPVEAEPFFESTPPKIALAAEGEDVVTKLSMTERPTGDRPAKLSAPKLASLVDPADFLAEEPRSSSPGWVFDPLLEMPLSASPAHLVPAPIELLTAAQSAGPRSLGETLNTFTIAIGVLALAAMCFAVSVVWTRIDRTAQTLQQPLPAHGLGADDAPSRRQSLDRLISNSLPMIEEQSQLPDRMDYHGAEQGRRRLMIDEPHSLAGPHFAVSAGAASSPREGTSNRSHANALAGNRSIESRLERVVGHIRKPELQRRVDSGEDTTGSVPTNPESLSPPEPHPQSRLLERVLIAMEREKRR